MATPASDTRPSSVSPGIADLIREAQEHPATPIIDGLLHEHEMAGLHGSPESFKTVITLQLAEAIATGQLYLGLWRIPQAKTVYFFETEMSVSALGKRLSTMYRGRNAPQGVIFASEAELRQFKRVPNLAAKFHLLETWTARANAEVLIIDTANPFFRGKESPNDETTVGEFFDRFSMLPAPTKVFVRHNHKPRIDDFDGDGASRIRGSGQWVDVPDLLVESRRKDKRTNEAELANTKFRHGTKPENLKLWFDAGDLRLISVPPVIRLLQDGPLSRTELLQGLQKRFGIEQRLGDTHISIERPFLGESQRAHNRVFEIDREAARDAEWFPPDSTRAGHGAVGNTQHCISRSVALCSAPR